MKHQEILHSRNNTAVIQCDLLGALPLELLKPGVLLDDSFATETEPEEVDLDTSFVAVRRNLLQSILQSKRNTKLIATQSHC